MATNVAGNGRLHDFAFLLACAVIVSLSSAGACQTGSGEAGSAAAAPAHPAEEKPAYEVATIKPVEPNGYALSVRVYIQTAFGIPANSTGWVIGPEWINSARYVIQAKPPDSIRDAMLTMTQAQRSEEVQLMKQSLLADRFKLKAHFEMKQMSFYELRVANGGAKLKENPDPSKGQVVVGSSRIRGIAVPMPVFCDLLASVPDIGGRVIIDKTGLAGRYDVWLRWTSLDAAPPTDGANATAPSPDGDGASLFSAIEEQLGLKLVATKGPGQVLVIDHIERPSEN